MLKKQSNIHSNTHSNIQQSLHIPKSRKVFGGALLKSSNPKTARPVSRKHAMHVVLRSSHAKGRRSFLHHTNSKAIDRLIRNQAKKWGVRLYRLENVGNHLHLVIRIHDRRCFLNFLRSVSGLIARHVLGAQRGQPQNIKFWDARPFSRIVTWGRAYRRVLSYMDKNALEAVGFNLNRLAEQLLQMEKAAVNTS